MIDAIWERLGRSAIYNEIYGGSSKEAYKEVSCVISRLEENKMKELIHEIDENAFVTVYDVAEVKGGNFKKHDIH
ncbi:hypothetical protein KQ1_02404 [Bacillus cereus BAG3O-1]|nr:hypothetical protein KQ1_02404 [Bacillus cereus BAG3O-1]SCV21420.1 Uncharacterized protein BCRIVMBC845_03967 [Bacillus cereus]